MFSVTVLLQKQERRTDIDDRWEFIEPYVDESTMLLDIGCAKGYYTNKAASVGAFALGVDFRSERLKNAREMDIPTGSDSSSGNLTRKIFKNFRKWMSFCY